MKNEIYKVSKWQQIKELTSGNLVGRKHLGRLLPMPNNDVIFSLFEWFT